MDRADVQTRILDHAEIQLLRQGCKGMRVDELARDAGISKRTLYQQFLTKEDIAREALTRRLERLERGVDQIVRRRAAGPDQLAQLRAIVTLIWQATAEARPAFYRDLATAPALEQLVERSRQHSAAKLDAVIRAGIKSGRLRAGLDPRLVRHTLLAAVSQIAQPEVLAQLLADQRISAAQACDAVLDVILSGVAAV